MRLVDADALMQRLGITDMDCDKCAWYNKKWTRCKRGGDFEDACCAIEDAPTIEERKKGKWIHGDQMRDYPRVPYKSWKLYCSACGKEPLLDADDADYALTDFCPNCGADMRGEGHG